MLYLLDANVLITANNKYYPISQIPEFWDWLAHQGSNGSVKIPIEVIEEVMAGRDSDLLLEWVGNNQEALLLEEETDKTLLQQVVDNGYARDLVDDEIEQLGRDPFLIAYGMVDAGGVCCND